MPRSYDLEYLVFQLSGGDITKDRLIWETVSYEECMAYVYFKQYEAYVNEILMKHE